MAWLASMLSNRSCRLDIMSKQHRSKVMSLIRSKNTRPEIAVRKMVFAMGRRYRLHVRNLPGCPDLVFARDRKLIFVHGCFWHQHAGCKIARMPSSRLSYWKPKLEGNRQKDRRNVDQLRRAGWSVLTIRECELRRAQRVELKLQQFLQPSSKARAKPAQRTRARRQLQRD